MRLLENVKVDYLAGRYHAVAPVLLTQMDGLVNDINLAERKGLHARDPNEMVAWDSVTAHHMGLSHALNPFHESFRKTRTETVTEVYRHGILHGNLIGYDNEVVATKAWNLLFAVADWAYGELNPPKPTEREPSLSELLKKLAEGRRQRIISKQFIENWQPWESDIAACDERGSEVIINTGRLLDAWIIKRWDIVGKEFGLLGTSLSDKQLAGEARELYQGFELTGYELLHICASAPAVQIVNANLVIDGQEKTAQLRWILVDHDTLEVGLLNTNCVWKLCPCGPRSFI